MSESTLIPVPAQYDYTVADARFAALDLPRWRELWVGIARWKHAEQWFYGDLFNAGRNFLPKNGRRRCLDEETALAVLKLLPALGIEPRTLTNWAYVADAFAPSERHRALTWSHHRELLGLPPAERRRWLECAAAGQWSVADLHERARAEERPEPEGPPAFRFVPRRWALDMARWCEETFPAGEAVNGELVRQFREDIEPILPPLKRLGIL
jgi:hypothetical protein